MFIQLHVLPRVCGEYKLCVSGLRRRNVAAAATSANRGRRGHEKTREQNDSDLAYMGRQLGRVVADHARRNAEHLQALSHD